MKRYSSCLVGVALGLSVYLGGGYALADDTATPAPASTPPVATGVPDTTSRPDAPPVQAQEAADPALDSALSSAAIVSEHGGPVFFDRADNDVEIAARHPGIVAKARDLGLPVNEAAKLPAAAVGTMQFPLRMTPKSRNFQQHSISNHVDLDSSLGSIKDFSCAVRTYDGHTGTDLFLWPYAWKAMENNELAIVAAQAGTIVEKQDGQSDQQCSRTGNPPANYVIIQHDNGLTGYYWHMKSGTVTKKAVGTRVVTGEFIGYVGSSGISSGPHLHFELRDASNTVIEPYNGACNTRTTSWTSQPATIDPLVTGVATHKVAPPSMSDNCAHPDPQYSDLFQPGETVFYAAYLRDQSAGQTATLAVIDPNGATVTSFTTGSPSSGYWPAVYWFASVGLPSNATSGIWRVRVTFLNKVHEHAFKVGGTLPSATISARLTTARTLTLPIDQPVTAQTVFMNTSSQPAYGCYVSVERPLLASTAFKAAGIPINQVFTVPPNSSVNVALILTARAGFAAQSARAPVQFKCVNSAGVPYSAANTELILNSQ